MKELNPRDRRDIAEFLSITGTEIVGLERYISQEWEWSELWESNFDSVDSSHIRCKCKFEALKVSGRRKGYPLSISALKQIGFNFILIKGGASWYEDAFYSCSCGQKWKEEFVEAMQYNGNHAFPVDEFK